jgi:hypothetical protein
MRNQKERDTKTQGYILFVMDTPAVSRAYLSRKLTRPLPTKDGGTLRTVLDARAYMLRLSKDRERSARWQRAAQLLLAKADVGAVSRQLELALLYDGKLDVRAMA